MKCLKAETKKKIRTETENTHETNKQSGDLSQRDKILYIKQITNTLMKFSKTKHGYSYYIGQISLHTKQTLITHFTHTSGCLNCYLIANLDVHMLFLALGTRLNHHILAATYKVT